MQIHNNVIVLLIYKEIQGPLHYEEALSISYLS
jgi:hypothetical protein